jgi:hypothetical protein
MFDEPSMFSDSNDSSVQGTAVPNCIWGALWTSRRIWCLPEVLTVGTWEQLPLLQCHPGCITSEASFFGVQLMHPEILTAQDVVVGERSVWSISAMRAKGACGNHWSLPRTLKSTTELPFPSLGKSPMSHEAVRVVPGIAIWTSKLLWEILWKCLLRPGHHFRTRSGSREWVPLPHITGMGEDGHL